MSSLTAPPSTADGPIVAGWRAALRGRDSRVALTDSEDPRALAAAVRLHAEGQPRVLLYGEPSGVHAAARAAGIALPEGIIVDVADALADPATVAALAAGCGGDTRRMAAARTDPLSVAAAALCAGKLDACVSGATRPTADVLRAGLRIVGLKPGVRTLSSAFLMLLRDGRRLTFADCAVVPDPDSEQLADIAIAAADTHRALTGQPPAIAMLSFSTQHSAHHRRVDIVRAATALVAERAPELAVDGDLQFDAAVIDSIGAAKAPGSSVAGHANVLVFPNLDAGNIGYKITERLAGAIALGPVLQGLRAPLNDLSRGCSTRDIEVLAILSAVQAL